MRVDVKEDERVDKVGPVDLAPAEAEQEDHDEEEGAGCHGERCFKRDKGGGGGRETEKCQS